MAVNVVMPHMGESVVEGTILGWLKQPGDAVAEDEPLVEIETDKINVEVPAPAAGVLLKVLAHDGDTVEVDQTIAVIGEVGEQVEAAAPATKARAALKTKPKEESHAEGAEAAEKAEREERTTVAAGPLPAEPGSAPVPPAAPAPPKPVAVGAEAAPATTLGVYASPAVRRFARERKVDLSEVEGTGRMGRITRQDVLGFIERKQAKPEPAAEAPKEAATPRERVPDVDEELVPLSKMRRAIAQHMVRSKHEAPHVTTVAEVDMSAVAAHREQWKPKLAEQDAKLTFTVYICNAVARALDEFPDLNAEWTDKGIIIKYRINLGLAVSVDDGLVVPVIRDVDRLSMADLAKAVQGLAERTRAGKVSHADLQGGTFTITNPGVFGAVLSTPIIHQPQAAILATGRIADVVAVVNGGIAIRKHMFLSLSYDHRIVDGATAVKFLQRVRQILEAADFAME